MNRGPMASTAISGASLSTRPSALSPTPQQGRRANLTRGIGGLLFGAVLGASQLAVIPARADEEQLQRQIDAMKRQLDAMQRELVQTKKQSAQQRAIAAPGQAGAPWPPGARTRGIPCGRTARLAGGCVLHPRAIGAAASIVDLRCNDRRSATGQSADSHHRGGAFDLPGGGGVRRYHLPVHATLRCHDGLSLQP